MMKAWAGILVAALIAPGAVLADPKCEADTFTGEKACVYGTGTIGMAGVGNQIITKDGQMFYRKLIMTNGDPLESEALLFRIDDRRTIRLIAHDVARPKVSCVNRHLCTWSWTVMAPISEGVLTELAQAKKLIVALEGKDHRRADESTMKKGGAIFRKFMEDIRANEPGVLASSKAEAFIQTGDSLIPYVTPALSGVAQ